MPNLDTHLSKLRRFAERLREQWQQRQELALLDRGELSRIASDFGMSNAEIKLLVERGPDAAALLYRRLAVLGLSENDVERVAPKLMRDLARTCACCDSKRACANDLDARPDDPAWKDYCPNAISIEAVKGCKGRFPA